VAARHYFRRLEKRRYDSIAAIEHAARALYLEFFMIEPATR
jgi:hypothetical protein